MLLENKKIYVFNSLFLIPEFDMFMKKNYD